MEKENEEIKKSGQNDEDSDELIMLYQEHQEEIESLRE